MTARLAHRCPMLELLRLSALRGGPELIVGQFPVLFAAGVSTLERLPRGVLLGALVGLPPAITTLLSLLYPPSTAVPSSFIIHFFFFSVFFFMSTASRVSYPFCLPPFPWLFSPFHRLSISSSSRGRRDPPSVLRHAWSIIAHHHASLMEFRLLF